MSKCCRNCKAPWGKLWFVILCNINQIWLEEKKKYYPAKQFGDSFMKNKSGAVVECGERNGGGSCFWSCKFHLQWKSWGRLGKSVWRQGMKAVCMKDGENVRQRERERGALWAGKKFIWNKFVIQRRNPVQLKAPGTAESLGKKKKKKRKT